MTGKLENLPIVFYKIIHLFLGDAFKIAYVNIR